MLSYEYHRLAERDFDGAVAYFHRYGMKPASNFILAVQAAIDRVRLQPKSGSPIYRDYRWVKTKGYSYTIFYRVIDDRLIKIYAVAQDRRRQGYWLRRTRTP